MTKIRTIDQRHRDLLTVCALRVGNSSVDWSLIARNAHTASGLEMLLAGDIREDSPVARRAVPLLREALNHVDDARRRVDDELAAAQKVGARLVTVLDSDYPANLRLVPNLPPFLFYRGTIAERDARSVAVVGTRQATEAGLRRAARISRELVAADVVVTSGLAKGVDTAAHTDTLAADGRTLAVMGTGIAVPVYPAQNRALAERVVERGALLSQFWPTSSGATWTFPRRNVVMSGISMGTVVIEASSTSGAKLQARIAAEHGKRVFLIRSLATSESWAAKMIADGRAIEVTETQDVLERLGSAAGVTRASQQRIQLALAGL